MEIYCKSLNVVRRRNKVLSCTVKGEMGLLLTGKKKRGIAEMWMKEIINDGEVVERSLGN